MISRLQRTPLKHNEQIRTLHDALAVAATPDIDAQCEQLRTFIRRETGARQAVGIPTAREILAAIGQLLNDRAAVLTKVVLLEATTYTECDVPTSVFHVSEPWSTAITTEG